MTYLDLEHRGIGFTSDKVLHVTAGVNKISSERYRCQFFDKDGVFELTGMAPAVKSKTQISVRTKPSLMKKADQLARLCQADDALIVRMNVRY